MKKGFLIPLKIPKDFYNFITQNKDRGKSLAHQIYRGFQIYKNDSKPQLFSLNRIPEKNKEEFHLKYKYAYTSIYMEIEVYNELIAYFQNQLDKIAFNTFLLNLLYLSSLEAEPSIEHDYFNDEKFNREFLFDLNDYRTAYIQCLLKSENGTLKQRDYNKYKAEGFPTLYNIVKKFGNYSVFIEEMEKIQEK